jgi:hypothetical protein
MLSDIGVFQTDNPEDAQIAEHQSLRDLQLSVNKEAGDKWEHLTGIHSEASRPSAGFGGEVTASAEVIGTAGETQESQQSDDFRSGLTTGPFIVSQEKIEDFDKTNCVGGTCDCVPLVKALTGTVEISARDRWREGEKVVGNSTIEYGTAIATFFNGRYPSKPKGNHAAIFLEHVAPNREHPLGGIRVLDQFPNRGSVGKRIIWNKGGQGYPSDDASRFSIILISAPPISNRRR